MIELRTILIEACIFRTLVEEIINLLAHTDQAHYKNIEYKEKVMYSFNIVPGNHLFLISVNEFYICFRNLAKQFKFLKVNYNVRFFV